MGTRRSHSSRCQHTDTQRQHMDTRRRPSPPLNTTGYKPLRCRTPLRNRLCRTQVPHTAYHQALDTMPLLQECLSRPPRPRHAHIEMRPSHDQLGTRKTRLAGLTTTQPRQSPRRHQNLLSRLPRGLSERDHITPSTLAALYAGNHTV